MSRPLRIEYPGAWYHVMNRGRRSENIFANSEDFKTFIKLLQESVDLWDIKVSAYCLMSSHYHLLIQTPHGNLSRFMRHLNGIYTQRYNRAHQCDGQLFRGRYKAILVEEDSYLLELVRYIHRNPLQAGLVEDIDQYPWSSHLGYLTVEKEWAWLHKEFVLSMMTTDIRKSPEVYRRFVEQEDSEEICNVFDKKKWPSILGSEEFVDWVKNSFSAEKIHSQVPDSGQLAPTAAKIQAAICQYYGIGVDELMQSKRGVGNEPRSVALFLVRTLRREGLQEISATFGVRGYSSASSTIERTVKRLVTDQGFQKRVAEIKQILDEQMSHA
jgi:REP element-mobilizing transposase RayT